MPTQARSSGARKFFGRGGTLSKWHPSYEFRSGQVEMAEAVESALGDRRHLIVEAGTGTTLGQAHCRLYRHQDAPGAAFFQGCPLSPAAFSPSAQSLLHEGPQQL